MFADYVDWKDFLKSGLFLRTADTFLLMQGCWLYLVHSSSVADDGFLIFYYK